jgi:D-alanyl-D-alanine carboxypeptidase (penicillin-binding protein 5/6)
MKRFISFFCIITFCFSFITIAYAEGEESTENISTLDLNAKSAVLMEASTGQILVEQNSHEKLSPASVTKVMTLLLIMEAIDKGDISVDNIVTTSEYAASMGGSQVFLAPGEEMSVKDMIKAIAIASGNDASVAMAEFISGSEEVFVQQMNKKAKDLGMNDTNFINCNGLDTEGHYTSAYDIALMSRELIKHPKIFEYLTIWTDSLRDGKFDLANTNKLIRFYKGADGIKTGSTSIAKYCLAATAKRDDMRFIAAVMAAPTSKDRFSVASKLLDHGFANYITVNPVKKGDKIGKIKVVKGMDDFVNVTTDSDLAFVIGKSNENNIVKDIVIDEEVTAPVLEGQKVGKIVIKVGDKKVGECNLVTENSVDKITFGKILKNLVGKWLNFFKKN